MTGPMPVSNHFMPAIVIAAGLAVGIATAAHGEKNISALMETGSMPASCVGSASLADTASVAVAASPVDTTSSEIRQLSIYYSYEVKTSIIPLSSHSV